MRLRGILVTTYNHVILLKPHAARLEIADWQTELESSEESPEQIVWHNEIQERTDFYSDIKETS